MDRVLFRNSWFSSRFSFKLPVVYTYLHLLRFPIKVSLFSFNKLTGQEFHKRVHSRRISPTSFACVMQIKPTISSYLISENILN